MIYTKTEKHFKHQCNIIREEADYAEEFTDVLHEDDRGEFAARLKEIKKQMQELCLDVYRRASGK